MVVSYSIFSNAEYFTIATLEQQVRFIFKKRTEAYIKYGDGASQKKIVHGAKNHKADQALLELNLGCCGIRVLPELLTCGELSIWP